MSYISIKYSVEIDVQKPIDIVFANLIGLSKWWPEDFKGNAITKDSEFTLTTGEGHYSINKVIEFVPNKKVAWQTLKSLRKSDNFDWSGTKFIFDLMSTGSPGSSGNNTVVRFTYDGVVQEFEAGKLREICDMTLKEMFYNYIVYGKGKK
jgi:hypothetical protein